MIEQYNEEVLRLVHNYPVRPHGFDPLTAPNQQLAQYGLPERPAAGSEPEAFAFWQEMVGHPPEPELPGKEKGDQRVVPYRQRQDHLRARFDQNSRNWSGAYITPNPRPNRCLQVAGAWIVGSPTVPRIRPSGTDRNNQEYRSSTWIGLGGHRPYNTLPQVGTLQSVKLSDGRPTVNIAAWWQWWIKDKPAHHVPMPIQNFPVQADDQILAMLTVEAPWPGDVRFNLKNQRTGRLVAFKVRAPARILPLGATAEWIHERPAKVGSRDRYPMPDCGKVTFRHCLAWSAPDLGMPMVLQRLDKFARMIRMVETFDAPHRAALVSIPQKENATSLSIRYYEPGTSHCSHAECMP